MEHCAGHVYRDASLPTLLPNQRRAIYAAMSEVLSKIHSTDLRAARLQDSGDHGERRLCILCPHFLVLCPSISRDRTWAKLRGGWESKDVQHSKAYWEGVESSLGFSRSVFRAVRYSCTACAEVTCLLPSLIKLP